MGHDMKNMSHGMRSTKYNRVVVVVAVVVGDTNMCGLREIN